MSNDETTVQCWACKSELHQPFHPCQESRALIDVQLYLEQKREANPLDRITLGEMMTIYGVDVDSETQRAERRLALSEERYFSGPLMYRIEFDPISLAPGFRPDCDAYALPVNNHKDADWGEALVSINKINTVLFLRKDEAYRCRLVSYDQTGRRYLWETRELEHQEGVGWIFRPKGN